MPIFKKVTDSTDIVLGGKYILVAKSGDKYYTATTGTNTSTEQLPAIEITPTADGNFTFMSTVQAMTIDLRWAHNVTLWGKGLRYTLLTNFGDQLSMIAPYSGFYFEPYDLRGSKYGYYLGVDSTGSIVIRSAYETDRLIRAQLGGTSVFLLAADTAADMTSIYLYRLTDRGNIGSNMYEMTTAPTLTVSDDVIPEQSKQALAGNNVIGVTDAMTQTAINTVVQDFSSTHSITNDSLSMAVRVDVQPLQHTSDSITAYAVSPVVVAKSKDVTSTYPIPDTYLDGETEINVTLCTAGVMPSQIAHDKEDGTREYFYPEYSQEVYKNGEKPFTMLYDESGNTFATFNVTQFSKIRLLANPEYKTVFADDNSVVYDTYLILSENHTNTITTRNDVPVKLERTFKAGQWSSLVLPFDISPDDMKSAFGNGVEIAYYSNTDAGTISFDTKADEYVYAHTPVLVRPQQDVVNPTFTHRYILSTPDAGPVITGEQGISFVGSYDKIKTLTSDQYFIANNMLWQSDGLTTLKATRAYFTVPAATASKGLSVTIDGHGIPTPVDVIYATPNSTRTIYDLFGRKIADKQSDTLPHHLPKGIYIINGKKVKK